MKQLTALILCLVLALSLAACGPAGAPDTPDPTQTETPGTAAPTEQVPVPTQAPTEEPTEGFALTDLVLVDSDACSFTVTGTDYNEHLGLQIRVLCENRTDRPLMFTWNNTSVCGFMHDPFWAEEVAPGKAVHSTVGIDTYALEQMGITGIDEVVFTLNIRDSEEFMNEPLVNDAFAIYPTGKTPDRVVYPEYPHKDGETVIVSNDVLEFIVESADDELADFYILNCYIANRTGKNLMISWDDVSVNGFMVDPYWAAAVSAGKQAYVQIIFYRSDLEAQDIEVVQDVEFRLLVSDYDDWESDYLLDGVYTFKPSY